MTSAATILCAGEATIVDLHLSHFTTALGVQCRMVRVDQMDNLDRLLADLGRQSTPCLMVSARSLAAIFQDTVVPPDVVASLFSGIKFVLVYGITPDTRETYAIRHLTEGLVSSIVHFDGPHYSYEVGTTDQEITKEFSGLAFGPINAAIDFGLVLNQPQTGFAPLVSINNLPIFASVKKCHARVFLLACSEIADLGAQTDGSWATHTYFSRLVPVMMFLRHVFQDRLWHNPRRYANFIIDDPLLRESYGFLNYAQLLQAMDRSKFTTTIAWIPWNYRRTSDAIAKMFRERSDRFSLCIHGCDHTEGEFASTERRRLDTQLHLAAQRMRAHEQSTGLPYDEVMVFPQGKFSSTAPELLKRHNYLAAVNSSAVPMDLGEAHGLTIADFLAPVISKYGGFPLFVRRYPREIVDFAFDLFLGKPALFVEHHSYFKNGYNHIQEFLTKINSLSSDLQWTSLGDLIKNTYLQRKIGNDEIECKLFANSQIIYNSDFISKQYFIWKSEDGTVPIKRILVNGNNHPYSIVDNHVNICTDIAPKSATEIVIDYENTSHYQKEPRNLTGALKIMMRRYLSEFRDNYLSRNEVLLSFLYQAKRKFF